MFFEVAMIAVSDISIGVDTQDDRRMQWIGWASYGHQSVEIIEVDAV